MLTLLPWMVLTTRSSKMNMVGIKTECGIKISEYKPTRTKMSQTELNRILRFVTESFWNVQNINAGSVRHWKLWQLWRQQLVICDWF